MSRFRSIYSSPNLNPSPPSTPSHKMEKPDELSLEGCTSTLKLLIKLMHDHNEGSIKDNDDRKINRVTGMINILDEVRTRLQKSQTSYGNKKTAELRRCNTDVRARRNPDPVPVHEDKARSKKELTAGNMAARKSLEMMCSSLGKEKEIMAIELSKKVHELNEMEEHVNDLKIQNSMLLAKLQASNNEQKEKRYSSGGAETQQGNAALQERNKLLSEQLLKALDGYRSLKKKLKDAQDEKAVMQSKMGQMGMEVAAGLERIRSLKHRLDSREDQPVDFEGEISALQNVLESLESKISRPDQHRTSVSRRPSR